MIHTQWILFIDDERMPAQSDVIIARNSYDAIWMVQNYGIPIHIMFDHDLGGQDTAMNLVSWLEELVYFHNQPMPEGFTYSIHSQNPVGAHNIKVSMDKLLEYCKDNF